jgi:hypothetical protein
MSDDEAAQEEEEVHREIAMPVRDGVIQMRQW